MAGPLTRPLVVAFDVVETLFSLEPLRPRFQAAGLPESSAAEWFARFLRDAFALEIAGVYKPFREVAVGVLDAMLVEAGRAAGAGVIDEVLRGFSELRAHPDVAPAFATLRDAGIRIATLSNGSAQVTQRLLERAKLDRFVERILSIDEVRHWKPHPEVYLAAARIVGVPPERMALVAAHSWDTLGASRAGLSTGFVKRKERFNTAMPAPTVTGDDLAEVVAGLIALPA